MYLETIICVGVFLLGILLMIYALIGSYNLYLRNMLRMRIEPHEILDLFYAVGISVILFCVSISALKKIPKEHHIIEIEIRGA